MKQLLFSVCGEFFSHTNKQILRMKYWNYILTVLVFSLITFSACNEPTIIGADLVEGEQGQIQIVDSFQISMKTVVGDTVIAYDPQFVNYANYLFGDFNDPVFGKSTAGVYLRFTGPSRYEGFDTTLRADSVVLVLPYDSTTFYGSTKENFSLDIFELTESLDAGATYTTDTTLMTEVAPLVSNFQFIPKPADSLLVIEPDGTSEDPTLLIPHLRIKLPTSFMDRLYETDSLTYESDSLFLEKFKGFYLKPATETNGMLSFNLDNDSGAGLYFYFHRSDSAFARMFLDVNRVIVPSFEQDTGAVVKTFIDNPSNTDSIFFIQGMKGLSVEMILPEMPELKDVIINKAELEISVVDLPVDDPSLFSPVDQLILSYFPDGNNNDRTLIDDIDFAASNLDNIRSWFGGDLVTGTSNGVSTYTMSIGTHLQQVLEGEIDNNLYLQPFSRAQNISRVVFKGTGANQNKAKLKVFYTEATD